MTNLFNIKNDIIYPTKDLKINSIESSFESNIDIIPPEHNVYKQFNGKTGKLLRFNETGGVCILKYIDDKRNIMFRNMIFRDKVKNHVFKFCSEENCIIKKDTPLIQIIKNVDYNFDLNELDVSQLSGFFDIKDNGFQKDICFTNKVTLLPKHYYKIDSGINVIGSGKYLFLSRLLWKYGLVILKSFEILKPTKNISFEIYNADDCKVTFGIDENYDIICSIIKLKD